MNYWKQSKNNIYVAAHRGWRTKYPENTIPAFQAALDIGVDQLECDVRVTYDNELVVIHDATVDRTTNGTGKVCEKTLAELRALDAGIHMGEEFRGVQIPTFGEFMELVKDHPTITLDVELKEYPCQAGNEERALRVCDRVLKMIDDYGFTDRVVINTWSNQLNEYIYKTYGKKYRQHVYYPLPVMKHDKPTMDPYSYAYCTCMFRSTFREVNIAEKWEFDRMESMGPRAWAGADVKDEKGVDMAIESGAELITCNNPDEILAILRRKGYHD